MIRVQKVEREDGLGPEYRSREPTDSQQLAEVFEERAAGACAKPNANEMVARKVNDSDKLGFWPNRTDIGVVNEIDDEPEAFEGCLFEETTVPRLLRGYLKSPA